MKMNIRLRGWLLGIMYLISGFTLNAQQLVMSHFSTLDGLPSSTIYDLCQDKNGYIWVATEAGVSRFDGHTFRNFTLTDGLSDNEILVVKEDSKGRVWFLGFNGTLSYWMNHRIYNASSDTLLKRLHSNSAFIEMFEDSRNRLWFVSQSETWLLDQDQIRHTAVPGFSLIKESNGQIYILHPWKSHLYQLSTDSLIEVPVRYKPKNNGAYHFIAPNHVLFTSAEGIVNQINDRQYLLIPLPKKMSHEIQNEMLVGGDSIIWLTSSSGLLGYSLSQPHRPPVQHLKNKTVNTLLEDAEGNLWIGTLDDGLYMIPVWAHDIRFISPKPETVNEPCYAVTGMGNRLFMGLKNGITYCVEPDQSYPVIVPLDTFKISKIIALRAAGGKLWIASNEKMIHYDPETRKGHLVYSKISNGKWSQTIGTKFLSAGKNRLFVSRNYSIVEVPFFCEHIRKNQTAMRETGSSSGCLSRTVVSLHQSRMYSCFEDKQGVLWIGARKGLYAIHKQRIQEYFNRDPLFTTRINCITELNDSTLILATFGHGIIILKNGKLLQQLTTQNGLVSNICKKVFVRDTTIYVSTPSGINLIRFSDNKIVEIIQLNSNNFLPYNDVNDIYADSQHLYIATSNGLIRMNHSTVDRVNARLPVLHIENVEAMGKSLPDSGLHELSFHQNNIRIRVSGIYFQLPKEVQYRYRLKENQPWQYTRSSEFDFPFLPSGEYQFMIQTGINGINWSDGVTYPFVILPPFWQTLWFRGLVLALIIIMVYLIVRYRIKQIKRKQTDKLKLERQITALEQEALQAMMNPHFIFNVMNSIQHFINSNDKSSANMYLSNFARLIRMNLSNSYKKYITLEEEMDYLQLYLSFEQLRFGDKLQYRLNLDQEIDVSETMVAVMLIQPFIENAIWHGILPTGAQGTVVLDIQKTNEHKLLVSVTDDGIGIPSTYLNGSPSEFLTSGHGMDITLKRLALISKASGMEMYLNFSHMHPESTLRKGTRVEFMLPITG